MSVGNPEPVYLEAPLSMEDIKPLKTGDVVRLSGILYTARDAAHARIKEAIEKDAPLPFDPEGQVVYFTGPAPARLCEVCAEVMAMTGAGIMLMSGDVARGSVCSSNPVSALIEDLQYTLGQGPCVDAYGQDQPVLEPDLAGAGGGRWIAFSPTAVSAGARAIFGFPMRVGAIRIGALNLYRDHPGPLDDEQYADGLVLASVAARAVLAMQADAPPGALSAADSGQRARSAAAQ